MKKVFILLVSLMVVSVLYAAQLEIKVRAFEKEIVAGMPLFLEVEIVNASSSPIEVPKLSGDDISASRTCKKYITKSNGERPSTKEFHIHALLGDYIQELTPMPTETLQPSESRKILLNYGETIIPEVLTFWIECDFYDNPRQYEKHYLTLDHKIISGQYKSNKLEINVEEPTGIDREVRTKFLNNRSVRMAKGRTKIIMEILQDYPESSYAPWLVCYSANSIIDSCNKMNPEQQLKIALKYKNWLRSDSATINSIKKDKDWLQIYTKLASLHEEHPCSPYFYLNAIYLATKTGEFNTACKLTRQLMNTKSRYKVDETIQKKACEYNTILRAYSLCK